MPAAPTPAPGWRGGQRGPKPVAAFRAPRAALPRYIGEELREAIRQGAPMAGAYLYPVLSHMGRDEDRYCPNGLFELEPKHGRRLVHQPLAEELKRQQAAMAALVPLA